MLIAIRTPEYQGRGVGGGECVGGWVERKGKKGKTTPRPLSSKLCMLLGWFLTNVLSAQQRLFYMKKTRLCAVIWQQCNVLCRAPRLFATSISLSPSPSVALTFSIQFTFAWLKGDVYLWARIKMQSSDKLNYCLVCCLSQQQRYRWFPQLKGRDGADYKVEVTGSH